MKTTVLSLSETAICVEMEKLEIMECFFPSRNNKRRAKRLAKMISLSSELFEQNPNLLKETRGRPLLECSILGRAPINLCFDSLLLRISTSIAPR